jgi:uncharacterized protein YbjQ (UPF0145 family)
MVTVTIDSNFQGFRITGYKGIACGVTFDELLQHAENMGANAIIGTCYDNALDVETLFHGAAVVIEPIQPEACGFDGPEGPPQRESVTVGGITNG